MVERDKHIQKRNNIYFVDLSRERKTQTDTMFRHTPSEACKEKRERVRVKERKSVSLGV